MAKILVVDDDPRSLRLTVTVLEQAGHEARSAEGGAETRTATLKVVALTALAMKGDRERLLAGGFDGYLEKPIRYKEFLAGVAALLEGRKE